MTCAATCFRGSRTEPAPRCSSAVRWPGFADVSDQLSERLPWFIGAVVAISVLLLMAVFRSVLVPLKAAVMNLLSIGAAYGVVVAVFQWGWGASLVGVDQTVPINPFVPMMMFAILFGLSMDYEVFLLSRIREEYQRTGDNHHAVVAGLGATARVITSAALIMIAVFGGFMANPATFMKMIGLGLSVAVLLDATVDPHGAGSVRHGADGASELVAPGMA